MFFVLELNSKSEYEPFEFAEYATQQYLPTSTTTDSYAQSNSPMLHNDLKRSHNDDDYDGESKRRYCAPAMYDTTSLQDSCIDDLINPDIGKRANIR